jgi:hypothetical protein
VRTNLVTSSSQLDNAGWSKLSGAGGSTPIVTANYGLAPDGTMSAERVQLARTTTSFSYSEVKQDFGTSGPQYTVSVYLKSLSGTPTIAIANDGSTFNYLATLTNDWVRYTATFTASGTTSAELTLYQQVAATSLTADFLVWGFQAETGDIATDYIATTTAAVSVGPVANVPRLDYLNSSCPSCCLEPQRVNLALFSESLDNAYWTNAEATTVSANVGVSPDGYTNADKLIPQATSNFHRLSRSFTVTTATPYTFSAFVKRAGYDYFLIRTSDAGNNNIGYDLLNGTVTYTASGYTSFIESYGNDWYRIGFVRSFTASTITINFRPNPTIISTNSLDNFTGDGTSGGFVWGAMLELGSPTPPRTSAH